MAISRYELTFCNPDKGQDLNTAPSVRSKDSALDTTSLSTTSAVHAKQRSSDLTSNLESASVRSKVAADVEIAQPFRKGTASTSAPRHAASGGAVWIDQ